LVDLSIGLPEINPETRQVYFSFAEAQQHLQPLPDRPKKSELPDVG
jgi:hypothetical protein